MSGTDFIIEDGKYAADEFAVEINCIKWLGIETVSSVAYSALDITNNATTDATATVLDAVKHSNTTTAVKPWIKAGTAGHTYRVHALITTSGAAKKTVTVTFKVV